MLLVECHIQNFVKCTIDCFLATVVITANKKRFKKLALNAKPMYRQKFERKYQMPNIVELLDDLSQIVSKLQDGELNFAVLDLKYIYSQLKLATDIV